MTEKNMSLKLKMLTVQFFGIILVEAVDYFSKMSLDNFEFFSFFFREGGGVMPQYFSE